MSRSPKQDKEAKMTKGNATADVAAARGQAGAYTHGGDTEFARENADINVEEGWSALSMLNAKRTYDLFQTFDADALHAARSKSEVVFNLATQALQNAVETANMVGKNAADSANLVNKQSIAHRDIAIDRTWNIDEVAAFVAKVIQTMQPTTANTDKK